MEKNPTQLKMQGLLFFSGAYTNRSNLKSCPLLQSPCGRRMCPSVLRKGLSNVWGWQKASFQKDRDSMESAVLKSSLPVRAAPHPALLSLSLVFGNQGQIE